MNPAPCSWRVRISLIFDDLERLSRRSRFSSPGTPKIYSTPSSSRHCINKSEAFIICRFGPFLAVAPCPRKHSEARGDWAADPPPKRKTCIELSGVRHQEEFVFHAPCKQNLF